MQLTGITYSFILIQLGYCPTKKNSQISRFSKCPKTTYIWIHVTNPSSGRSNNDGSKGRVDVVMGPFHTYLVWSRLFVFSVWSKPKCKDVKPFWTMVWPKQLNLSPTKRAGLGLDQIELSNFRTNYRKLWAMVAHGDSRGQMLDWHLIWRLHKNVYTKIIDYRWIKL